MTATNVSQYIGAVDGSRRGRILHHALLTVYILALVLGVTVYCHARKTDAPDCSQWEIIFDGYGETSYSDGLLCLKPTSTNFHDTVYADLATSTSAEVESGGVQTIHTTMTTVERLREDGNPNAWEVTWLLWDYTDNNHFYALALKPNGWEVSKRDTAYPGYRRLLSSGNTPVYPPGESHGVTVTTDTTKPLEAAFTITMDGQELRTITDKRSPYRSDRAAAYCEDSDVTFTSVAESE